MSEKVSKRDKAFELFDEGKTSSSPEVKALGLKGTTRYNYYADWQKSKGVTSPSQGAISEAKGKGKAISEFEMVVPEAEKELGEGKVKEGQETGEGKAGKNVKGKIPRVNQIACLYALLTATSLSIRSALFSVSGLVTGYGFIH